MAERELWEGWIPQNPKEKIEVAIKIIRTAASDVQRQFDTSLKTQQNTLNERNNDIERTMQRNQELRLGLEDIKKQIKDIGEENIRLRQKATNLSSKNSKYAQMRQAVMSSFEKEVQEPERYESFTMPVRRAEEFNLPARRTEEYIPNRHPFECTQQLDQVLSFSPSRTPYDLTPPVTNYGHTEYIARPPLPPTYSPLLVKQGTSFKSESPLSYTASAELARATEPTGKSYVDGKKLFREMRQTVPTEIFSKFLQSVKKLNDRGTQKEIVLEEIRELLGSEFRSFYENFANLISNPL